MHCNYGALLKLSADDTDPPSVLFSHFANYPGLSVGPAAVLYDEPSQLYWMVSNAARDSTMPWNPASTTAMYDLRTCFTLSESTPTMAGLSGLFVGVEMQHKARWYPEVYRLASDLVSAWLSVHVTEAFCVHKDAAHMVK
jgi:hypothetical protein